MWAEMSGQVCLVDHDPVPAQTSLELVVTLRERSIPRTRDRAHREPAQQPFESTQYDRKGSSWPCSLEQNALCLEISTHFVRQERAATLVLHTSECDLVFPRIIVRIEHLLVHLVANGGPELLCIGCRENALTDARSCRGTSTYYRDSRFMTSPGGTTGIGKPIAGAGVVRPLAMGL